MPNLIQRSVLPVACVFFGAALQVETLQGQSTPLVIEKVGNGVSTPVLIFRVYPEYPEALKAKHTGVVTLGLIVDVDGKPRDIHVRKGLGMGFDEKAIEAVEKWLFKPSLKDGQPVNVRAEVEVGFRPLREQKQLDGSWEINNGRNSFRVTRGMTVEQVETMASKLDMGSSLKASMRMRISNSELMFNKERKLVRVYVLAP